ncbi:GNAT family N-acetyltransferase [Planomicrobium okeanokoites]|uniref:GNAT family N-acetyltransferase n=1 Tax=Planomicrobium okeanokoites TaxID=244 RepID=A0ABV7KN96_PLAOK|nr:GNAT family N-acetyltransferase [Planomicrobium okeanokoites]TAA67358.1 GNAT family N-acetyltransferase [Planomicrobium okeanokoites]
MYELVSASQTNRWQQILDLFNITDIYYTCEYLVSALKLDPGQAVLFYFLDDSGEGEVAYPFIKREIKEDGILFYDITTPFGYGGPLLNVKGDGYKLAANFLTVFTEYCHAEKIAAEFIRFHPLLNNAEFFKDHLDLISVHNTYTLPLKSAIFHNQTDEHGNSPEYTVKKLGTVKHMFDFLVLYYSTIRMNEDTDSYYFFTNDYFESLVSALGPNLHLFGAYKENKLLAACYLLAKGEVIYHHLSGTAEGQGVPEAESELRRKIAVWGAENNYLYYHLGGKTLDGLEKSLTSISSKISIDTSTYFISRLVHDKEIYKTFHPLEQTELIKRYGNV